MNGVIIHINGWPGAGKYTVGRIVARYLGARLVPNHVLCGPGFCVAEFGDPVFFEVARKVRAVVYERIAEAPPDAGFVLTSVLIDGADDAARLDAIEDIAARRQCPFLAVTLDCAVEANLQRLNTADRAARNSLTDVEMLRSLRETYELLPPRGAVPLVIDATTTTARESATTICDAAERLLTDTAAAGDQT